MDLKKLLLAIKSTNEIFNNNDHHDAHEFLIFLLNYFHETYLSNEKKKSQNKFSSSLNEQTTNYSPFSEIFFGTQISKTKCLVCQSTTSKKETFINVGVDIEYNHSLTSSLKNYTSKEILKNKDKFYCEVCNNHLEAEKTIVFDRLPKSLIIQLKRFKIEKERIRKLSFCVNFPFELNLGFVLDEKKSSYYNLSSIVVHVGSGLNQGHYFSIVKHKDNWYKLDDEIVRLIKQENIIEIMGNPDEDYGFNSNNCAYLLFYERNLD